MTQLYFVDGNGAPYAFNEDADPSFYEGMQRVTEDQAKAAANPPPPVTVILERAKDEIRALRPDILDAVTGIGFRASIAGNAELAKEAAEVSQQLLDITDDPSLNAARTYEEMSAAGVAAFRRIASEASEAFSATFKEFK